MVDSKNRISPMKNKKGVSVMIGYILLITFAIVIAIAVYSWLNTYVPKEGLSCPDGVSMYISDYEISDNKINLTFVNNGNFDIHGMIIRYSNESSKKIADKNFKGFPDNVITGSLGKAGFQFKEERYIEPSETKTLEGFKFQSSFGSGDYLLIEATPIRIQEKTKRLITCSEAKTRKIINQ